MEAGETPTPPARNAGLKSEEVRRATFPQTPRGYDREAVHDLLDRVADWMEGKAGAVASATPGMREELAKVGERTAGILTAAEEAGQNLLQEASEYAESLRSDADAEVRESRLNASQRMDEMIAEAETKAQRIIDDAVARRRQLNQAITSLLERRDEIADEASKLADELMHAVGALRTPEDRGEVEAESQSDAMPAESEPDTVFAEPESDDVAVAEEESSSERAVEPAPDEAETTDPELDSELEKTVILEADSEETELYEPGSGEFEPDSDEFGTRDEIKGPSKLLVDPDEDTPPRGVPNQERPR